MTTKRSKGTSTRSNMILRGEHPVASLRPDYVDEGPLRASELLPGNCTYAELAQRITDKRNHPLIIEELPDDWKTLEIPKEMSRGQYEGWSGLVDEQGKRHLIVRGFASELLKSLTGHFENVVCEIVGKTVRVYVARKTQFWEVAGRLTDEATKVNGRIPEEEYDRILTELDEELDEQGRIRFRATHYLEGHWKTDLRTRNRSNPNNEICTFRRAYHEPCFTLGVQRTLNRAQAKWRESRGIKPQH